MRVSPSVSTLVPHENPRLTVQKDGDTLVMNETLGGELDILTLKDPKNMKLAAGSLTKDNSKSNIGAATLQAGV